MPEYIQVIVNALPNLLTGLVVTLKLASLAAVLAMIGGVLMGILSTSSSLTVRNLVRGYVDFFRGSPLLIQLFIIYFGIPKIAQDLGWEIRFDRFIASVVAISLNNTAYISEIIRAGIQSIEQGQIDAAQSLGLGSMQAMRHVVFPQAFSRVIPPLGNQFIVLTKDTSVVSLIGFEEMLRHGQLIVADNLRSFEIYGTVALIYVALTITLSILFSQLENWATRR